MQLDTQHQEIVERQTGKNLERRKKAKGGETGSSARYSTGSNEGSSSSNSEYETQLVVVQLPNEGGYVVTHLTKLRSVHQVMEQLKTQDVALSDVGFTYRREARRYSQVIHGFEVFDGYDDALATQQSAAKRSKAHVRRVR
jgi:hypothetical protein